MTRFTPSRRYLTAGLVAFAFAALSAWCGERWWPAYIPAVLFVLSGFAILALALQPRVEIHPEHLAIGSRVIAWRDIMRVDHLNWRDPLLVRLLLREGQRVLVIFPGEEETSLELLRAMRRNAREALIDGETYRDFWREATAPLATEAKQVHSPRYRLLRAEDEDEVERLFQRLKTVGHLDPKKSGEDR